MGRAGDRGVGVALILTLALLPSASESSVPTVGVVVRSSAGVRAGILKGGLAEASRLYRREGITVAWLLPGAKRPEGVYYLNVLTRDEVTTYNGSVRLGTTPGWPEAKGRIAYVFMQPIEQLANRYGVDQSLVLGAAMTHELAHLLLSNRGHSERGLMRARWGVDEARAADRGMLRFSLQEYEAIHAGLRSEDPSIDSTQSARR